MFPQLFLFSAHEVNARDTFLSRLTSAKEAISFFTLIINSAIAYGLHWSDHPQLQYVYILLPDAAKEFQRRVFTALVSNCRKEPKETT